MRSRRPTPCSPAIVFRLSINSPRRIVTPLMPTAAPRSNSISTCAGFTGASSRRRVILNSDSSASRDPSSPRRPMVRPQRLSSMRLTGVASPAFATKPVSSAHAISFSVGLSVEIGCASRRRSRPIAPWATCEASSIAAIETSVFAITGRVSAVAIGYRVSERAPALSDGSTMSRANSSRASITWARAAPADSACVRISFMSPDCPRSSVTVTTSARCRSASHGMAAFERAPPEYASTTIGFNWRGPSAA